MKKKLEKKLALNKATLVNLDNNDQMNLRGGIRYESDDPLEACDSAANCTAQCSILVQNTGCIL